MVKNDDGKSWSVKTGMIQVARINAPDVGEVSSVKITCDNDDAWSPQWFKLNTNDFSSGLGNGERAPCCRLSDPVLGIYYTTVQDAITKDTPLKLGMEGCTAGAEPCLVKCDAMFCKKAEKRLLAEGDDEPPISHHGGHYGPLGEGMPGTERDETMT